MVHVRQALQSRRKAHAAGIEPSHERGSWLFALNFGHTMHQVFRDPKEDGITEYSVGNFHEQLIRMPPSHLEQSTSKSSRT